MMKPVMVPLTIHSRIVNCLSTNTSSSMGVRSLGSAPVSSACSNQSAYRRTRNHEAFVQAVAPAHARGQFLGMPYAPGLCNSEGPI